MQIKILDDNFDKKLFNQKALHPMQSWEWGEAKKKTGVDVIRIIEFVETTPGLSLHNIHNVYQMTLHKIPHTHYKVGYIPRSNIPSPEVLEFLYNFGKKNNVIFIKFEPNVLKKNFQFSIFNFQLTSKLQIQKSMHPLFPSWTIMLDLTKSEEELLKNMKSKTRYNIKLAQKKGVYIKEESDEKGFEKFIKLYLETCRRQKYFGHDYSYHKVIWDLLKNNIANILIAYYEDTPLVSYELFVFNNVLYYPYGGSSDLHRNLMPANILMWEAIKYGKKSGAKTFDMWGSLAPGYDTTNPWAGFTHFKEGYGGEFIELIGSYDMVISPLLYKLYNLVYKLRNIYLTR